MNDTNTKTRRLRMARESTPGPITRFTDASSRAPSRLGQLEALLCRGIGASIVEMTDATGWQAHSIRGAMAGALKKRGLVITSEKIDTVRRYSATKVEE